VCPSPKVEFTEIDWLFLSILKLATLTVTLCECPELPVMLYVFSAPALTSAIETVMVCPWLLFILLVVPFAKQSGSFHHHYHHQKEEG